MTSRRGRLRPWLLVPIGVVLLGSLAVLAAQAFGGARLVKVLLHPAVTVHGHNPTPWLILALVGAVAALLGWIAAELGQRRSARAEETLEAAQSAERRARDDEHQARERLDEAEQRLHETQRVQQREREQHQAFARAWKSQRDWNRELRSQVANLQQRHGVLGHFDVHEMILRLTLELVEAEKGILLTRRNGEMEVVCSAGFTHDPRRSALAARFGKEVIDQDTAVRVDDAAAVHSGPRSPADDEVGNLLAIPIYLRDDFHGVIVCANLEGGTEDVEEEVLVSVGDHAGAVLENSRLHGELRNAYLQTVRTLSSVIEVKDPDLRGHSDAVAEYVLSVADQLGFEPHHREELLFGALLHDVGKIGISERILLKPARLSDEELSVMQLHPRIGYHLVRQIPALEPIAPAILHHHERYDGTGYPSRLRGELIPLEARIIAVADAFSAMITERPYSRPRTVEEACTELERCAGGQFDPEVVKLFVAEVRRRPPNELARDPFPPDPEIELHRQPGSFVLGGSSFGLIDSLTLLYSHRHFHETLYAQIQRASLQGRTFTVIVGRLENLAQVNREQGYAAGDAALQRVGEVFRRAAAHVNGIGFRVSGRRIGLVGPDLDQADAQQLLTALRVELRAGTECGLGLAVWRPGESAEQLVERAIRAAQPGDAALAPPPA